MATTDSEFERANAKFFRDMRSDMEAGWWGAVKRRAEQILAIVPDCEEAQECLKKADAALAAKSPQQETVLGTGRNP